MESKLYIKPSKQEPWHIHIHDEMNKSKRIIDTMSQGEIYQMYKDKEFVCDMCGVKISNVNIIPIEQHMIHLIDTTCHWVCESCERKDFENNNVIAVERIETIL